MLLQQVSDIQVGACYGNFDQGLFLHREWPAQDSKFVTNIELVTALTYFDILLNLSNKVWQQTANICVACNKRIHERHSVSFQLKAIFISHAHHIQTLLSNVPSYSSQCLKAKQV